MYIWHGNRRRVRRVNQKKTKKKLTPVGPVRNKQCRLAEQLKK
jgi:hypothetical protein